MAVHELPVKATPTGLKIDLSVALAATKAVLADRERELLELKGPCSGAQGQPCHLHYAHSGPCDTREALG